MQYIINGRKPNRSFEEVVYVREDSRQRDGQHHNRVEDEGQNEVSVDANPRALEGSAKTEF